MKAEMRIITVILKDKEARVVFMGYDLLNTKDTKCHTKDAKAISV